MRGKPVGLGGQQVAGERRDDRARQEVGGQYGEHHGHRQRPEQRRRGTAEEEQRHEDDRDGKRRHHRRRRDLRGAIHDGLQDLFSLRHVAVDVLDLHRRVVHQDADGEREPAQRHHVERLAQRREPHDRAQDGERNRRDDDERAAPAPQEQQDHERGETRGDHRFTHDTRDRRADEDRLIRQQLHVERRRERRLDRRQQRLHLVHHRQARRVPVLQHAHVGAVPPVVAHDVRLHARAVTHIRDVADVDHRPVHPLDRHVVELPHDVGARVQAHVVLARPQLRRAGGENHVLRVDRGAHVRRRQPFGVEARQVDVDVDQPGDAAKGGRQHRSSSRRERRPHEVADIVIQLRR